MFRFWQLSPRVSIITHHLVRKGPRIIHQKKEDRIKEGKNNQDLSVLTRSTNIIGSEAFVSKTEGTANSKLTLQTPQMLRGQL